MIPDISETDSAFHEQTNSPRQPQVCISLVQLISDKGAKLDVWNRKNKYGWTPLLIAEGFRPGNFKPSAETIDAIHRVMRSAGVTPPPPTPRPVYGKKGYDPSP